MNHSVNVSQQATGVSTPSVAESGLPFVIGIAPVLAAEHPAAVGAPVLCTSWDFQFLEPFQYTINIRCRSRKNDSR